MPENGTGGADSGLGTLTEEPADENGAPELANGHDHADAEPNAGNEDQTEAAFQGDEGAQVEPESTTDTGMEAQPPMEAAPEDDAMVEVAASADNGDVDNNGGGDGDGSMVDTNGQEPGKCHTFDNQNLYLTNTLVQTNHLLMMIFLDLVNQKKQYQRRRMKQVHHKRVSQPQMGQFHALAVHSGVPGQEQVDSRVEDHPLRDPQRRD